jgi:hypothetical protein
VDALGLPRYLVIRDDFVPRNMSATVQKRERLNTYRDLASTSDPIR